MDNTLKADLIEKFRIASNRLILLDYDGTLVNYAAQPEKASPSEQLLALLMKLDKSPHSKVSIISGRGTQDLDRFLGHLPIDIIAEHGAIIRVNEKWEKQIIDNSIWKTAVKPLFSRISLKCPGSFMEEKNFSLAWHYRNVDSKSGYACSRDLIDVLKDVINTYNLRILDGNKVVELLNREIGKGKAVKKIMEQNSYDFILSIGDDATDEEIFKVFSNIENCCTIKVGNGSTLAKYKLDTVEDVILFLKHLSE